MSYDLFISYARRDNERHQISSLVDCVSRTFERVAARPLRLFFDVTEIHSMQDWRHRIMQGLRDSRLLFACISPAYFASENCKWEFYEYLNHEVGRGFVSEGIAAVYLVDVSDWHNQAVERQPDDWLCELSRRQYLDLRVQFSQGESALRNLDLGTISQDLIEQMVNRIRRVERAEQSPGNVYSHNPHFIGRSNELRRLRETAALGRVGVVTAIHGLAGVGKTGLAIEYAHTFAHEYGGGCWQISCNGQNDLRLALISLASTLQLQFSEADEFDKELQFQRVLSQLRSLAQSHEPNRCLLLLDNVDDATLLEPVQVQCLQGADWLHVISTTRLGENELFGRHHDRGFVPVDELSEVDALDLIESYQPGGNFPDENERAAALGIARLLGGFTLAIEVAGVFLGQFTGDISCSDFLQRLKDEGLPGLDCPAEETSEGVLHGERRLKATLQPTLQLLTKPEEVALNYAALLPSDHIVLSWIRPLIVERFPEFTDPVAVGHPDPWRKLVRRLLSLRLWQLTNIRDANGEPQVLRMHQLLQRLVEPDAQLRDTFEDKLLNRIKDRAKFLWDNWMSRENRWEVAPLVAFAWQSIETRHKDGGYLANQAAYILQSLGNFSEAEMLMRRALDLDEYHYGADHDFVATRLNNLAHLLMSTGRLEEAETLFRRAVTIYESSLGGSHPQFANALSGLGMLLGVTNRVEEAEPLFQKALQIHEQSFGPNHPNVAIALTHLAQLFLGQNRISEAEPLCRRALKIYQQTYGPDHPRVSDCLYVLAEVLQAGNKFEEAEPLCRRALEIDELSLGPNHPSVARKLEGIVKLLYSTNRFAEAEQLCRRALAISEESFGPNHLNSAENLINLALLLQETGKFQEAECFLQRAVSIYGSSLGEEHTNFAYALSNLGTLLMEIERFDDAEPVLERACVIFQAGFGSEHPLTIDAQNSLGELKQKMNSSRRRDDVM